MKVETGETTAQAYARTEREAREKLLKRPIYLTPPTKSHVPKIVGLSRTSTRAR